MRNRQFSKYYNIVRGKDGKTPYDGEGSPMVVYNLNRLKDISLLPLIENEVRDVFENLGFTLEGCKNE